MNAPRVEFHCEEQIECRQAALGPDFDRREINRRYHIPMGFEERGPRHAALAVRSWFYSIRLENVADSRVGDVVAAVGQGALNAIVTPGRILLDEF